MGVLDFVAFGAMIIAFIGIVVFVIWLGDLPGQIAKSRNHPQRAAVTALSWLGLLFTGGLLWIFAFSWAFYVYPGQVIDSEPGSEAEVAP